MNEILAEFGMNGLEPGELILDGKHHRFQVDNGDTKKSGWYKGYQNHTRKSGEIFYVVLYGNHKTGEEFKFVSDGVKLSKEDQAALKKQMEESRKHNEEEKRNYHEQTSKEVSEKWNSLPLSGEHDYLTRKGIRNEPSLGIRFSTTTKTLYVPLSDSDRKLWSVQAITESGEKQFHPGGRVDGCYHTLGELGDATKRIYVAEGFSTGATIYQVTGVTTVIAFNAGRLASVAQELRKKYPKIELIIAGDDDRDGTRVEKGERVPFNAGRTYATEAAKLGLGTAIFPIFKDPHPKATDFNDLFLAEGAEAVYDQLKVEKSARQYVIALGFKEKEYFFTSSKNKQITSISAFKEVDFLNLMPIEYWEAVFPGAGAQRVNWVDARSALMEQCRDMGIFQERRVRGAGVWNDEGRIIINLGDHLIVDGSPCDLGEIDSRYFYTLGVKLNELSKSPLSLSECDVFIEACSSFRWLKSDYSFLLAGALVCARICGALPVRPHTWITGGAQTGKSTLLQRLIKPIIGEPVFYAIGGTSEAGVRQSLKADAIPVIFDEFETTGVRSAEKIAEVVELMRAAWSESDAYIVKGGASGNATSFQVRFSAIVSSIRINLKNDADRSRFSVIELAPHQSDLNHWQKLSGLLDQINQDYGDRLFARTIKMLPILLANYLKIKKAFARKSSQRFGDQYGMQLAGYSILISDEEISEDEAELLTQHVSLLDEKEEAKMSDHEECLIQVMTKKIQIQDHERRYDFSIGDAIHKVIKNNDAWADEALQLIGIRVSSNIVAIANRHLELENSVFRGTRWSNTWSNSLSRIPGAQKNKSVWLSGRNVKCTVIPNPTLTEF